MKLDNNLKKINKILNRSELTTENGNISYDLTISAHLKLPRYISITKGSEDRLLRNFNIKRLNHVIRPYLEKMVQTPGKYLISMEKEVGSTTTVYLLIVVEPHAFDKDRWFVSLITMVEDETLNMTFKKIPVSFRISRTEPYSELFNKKGLMTEAELLAESQRNYTPKHKPLTGLKIKKKKNNVD